MSIEIALEYIAVLIPITLCIIVTPYPLHSMHIISGHVIFNQSDAFKSRIAHLSAY